MPLKLMYITNNPKIALIAEKSGVERIWVDLETLGKKERQKNRDTVISQHQISDISKIKPLLSTSEMLVRINPINPESKKEINAVIEAQADIIMLPMYKSATEVEQFLSFVNGRAKTVLLLETKEAAACLDEVLQMGGFDEIHIGLNDLHLSCGLSFMFELISNGVVEMLCKKIKKAKLPYGFGGIAKLGGGVVPSEKIITEHYRLGSTRAILSRSFCDTFKIKSLSEIENIFMREIKKLRAFEQTLITAEKRVFALNKAKTAIIIQNVAQTIKNNHNKTPSAQRLNSLCKLYGSAFYLLDSERFITNYKKLKEAFSCIYQPFNIAYSYKTNYIPKLCRIVNDLGGYAEVVSDMELELAQRVGVQPQKIIYNGPVKNLEKSFQLLVCGGVVNVDSLKELISLEELSKQASGHILNIGIRCNFAIGDKLISRFGIDVGGSDFEAALRIIGSSQNLKLASLQCHFADRNLRYWPVRGLEMIKIFERAKNILGYSVKIVDLGGGIYGDMPDSLQKQFQSPIPKFEDYAKAVAKPFAKYFSSESFELLTEPGTALAADCLKFVCKVENIKAIGKKNFATVLCSQKNINMPRLNPPIEIIASGTDRKYYNDIDIAGYTCIENDVLYKGYCGELAENDFIVFSNCGSYSIVMKPPFILPSPAIIEICGSSIETIKRKECFNDLFSAFAF